MTGLPMWAYVILVMVVLVVAVILLYMLVSAMAKSISDGKLESLVVKVTKWFSIDAKWKNDNAAIDEVRTPPTLPKTLVDTASENPRNVRGRPKVRARTRSKAESRSDP